MSILFLIADQFSFEYIYFILHFPEHSRAIYFDFRTVLFLKCLKAQFSFEKIWLMLQKEKNKTSSQQSVYAAVRLAYGSWYQPS